MYLKRLELQGFKSFPEKIRLEFNRGITAIVGPNGSGKSNVADGVRWVLGEQSAKSLRGAKMEDIIFAGTENRRPQGFAEVSMVIDNSGRKMPVEFSEIAVTRRVYRSGDSEFYINGVQCRLKDIHEMFMDTGVGREGYSIIGQGRIDEILSSRSEDRRLLFEEAAGIAKYKSRRQEAEQKLARQRQNLTRVDDIISELELQLSPLFEQSEKARVYLDLREELKLIQVNLFVYEAERSESELKKSEENCNALNIQILAEQERLAEYRSKIEQLRQRSQDIDLSIKTTGEELTELRLANEKRENDIRLAAEQINHFETFDERLNVEIRKKSDSVLLLKDRIRNEESAKLLSEDGLSGKRAEIEEKQRDFDRLSEKLKESEQQTERYNTEIIELIKTATDIKAEIQKLQDDYERLENRKEQLNEEYAKNETQLIESGAKLSQSEQRLNELSGQLSALEEDNRRLVEERAAFKADMDVKTKRQFELNKNINESSSRHKLLSELEKSHEGYNKSVKSLLSVKDSLKGIHGAVGGLLETDKEYETAIEIALGGAIQNVVTDSEEDAREAVEYLKRSGEGRVTFLPLTAIKGSGLKQRAALLSEPGTIGVASELVRCDGIYGEIFSNLLGRTIIVDNMDNAIRISKKYGHNQRIVTLDGELFSPGGAITGGSLNHKALSIVSRMREIKELSHAIDAFRVENAEITEALERLRRQVRIIDGQLEDNREASRQRALEEATLKQSLIQTRDMISHTERKKIRIKNEDESLMNRLVETNKSIRGLERRLLNVESEADKVKGELNKFLSAISGERGEKDHKLHELSDLRVELSEIMQAIKSSEENIARINGEIEGHNTEIERCRSELDKNQVLKKEKMEEIENHKREILKFGDLRKAMQESLAALDDEKEDVTDEIKAVESDQRDCSETLGRLGNELTRLEMKKEQAQDEVGKLYDLMWDEYKLTLQTAREYRRLEIPVEQMRKEERKAKNALSEMGDVNVGAILEYKNVKARYEQMTTQREDILKAEEKLRLLIEELTGMMERQFAEQFKIISQNFTEVFREMFGGGKAFLKLNDENDVLESGIEISAQPPGKNLQSMSLLSGGERALTAIALLFGILRMKPSPFCIFDEVEAALDDANVTRFANFLKNFSDDTQFILITHRKGTMEAADSLYGVTMQEQGISKMISVKFTDNLKIKTVGVAHTHELS